MNNGEPHFPLPLNDPIPTDLWIITLDNFFKYALETNKLELIKFEKGNEEGNSVKKKTNMLKYSLYRL